MAGRPGDRASLQKRGKGQTIDEQGKPKNYFLPSFAPAPRSCNNFSSINFSVKDSHLVGSKFQEKTNRVSHFLL